ncbi:phospholipase D-like domain-containing protein [Actinokineospora sp. UTMC 2448]|uniref:phospholipase D-like domain-containing protein n=1 Tax=Actinokineospora sp. UTMC 2448 TaxID=2268449 RepID=UPI0021649531|nr:phospholipase D-like domain-containing protein [Actinokineospora sp. UTMC 2448]UVS78599.1 Phospholipase D Active site motif [Actinokineospora sp. UTMC 2448]
MKTLDVYIQCEVHTARILLAPKAHTSILETLVLKAIAAGITTVQALSDLFNLTPRLMVDLLGDLWRTQRVVFEFDGNGENIKLTAEASEELARLSPDEAVEASLCVPSTEDVILDPLTGRVLPTASARSAPGRANLVVTRMPADLTVADIEPDALAAGLNRSLDRRGDLGHDGSMRVVKAYLAPHDLTAAGRTMFLAMSVQVALDGERLVIRVADERLTPAMRETAANRLQNLVETEPQSAFAQALRGAADHILEEPKNLRQQLADFSNAAQSLTRTAVANRRREHDRLVTRAGNLDAQLADMASRQMSVTVVRSAEEHHQAVIDLLGSAERQVVMAVPWLHHRGVDRYVDAMKSAVRRGVQITVLWGINRDDGKLDAAVVDILRDVQRAALGDGAAGALRFDDAQPAHVHAKLVLVDDRRVLVTSRNFFTMSDQAEIGVVAAADPMTPSPVLDALLVWAHQTSPNYDHARAIIRDRSLFGDRSRSVDREPIVSPSFDPTVEDSPDRAAAVTVWSQSWTSTGHGLAETFDSLRPVVQLVRDHFHSALLWKALRTAERRILVTSDQFSSAVVNPDFLERVRECLGRGVNVALVYGRLHRENEDGVRVRELRGLAEGPAGERVGQLTVLEKTDNHAKVLVIDDDVVVGSYNYLSFDGRYGAGRRRQRSEVSLHITAPDVASDVARSILGGRFPAWAGPVPGRVTAQGARHGSTVYLAAQEILRMLADTGTAFDPRNVVAACRAQTSPLDVIDVLTTAGATTAELQRVYAALFAAADPGTEEHATWGRLLSEALWTAQDWQAAHLVQGVLPDSPDLRPPLLTAAAAAYGTPALAELVADAFLGEVPADEGRVLSVFAAVDLLINGDNDLVDAVEALAGAAGGAAWTFVQAVTGHVRRFGPVPTAALRARAEAARSADASARTWIRVSSAVNGFKKFNPGCVQGDLTMEYLFGPQGPLAALESLVASRDAPALSEWSERNGTDEGRWLDTATKAANSPTLITDTRRRSMLAKSSTVLVTARRAAADLAKAQTAVHTTVTVEHLRAIAGLAVEAQAMRAALGGAPASGLAIWALDKLTEAIRGEDDA